MSDIDLLFRDFADRIRSERSGPIVQKAFGARPLIGPVPPPLPPELLEPPIPQVRVQRIEEMLSEAAMKALSKIRSSGRLPSQVQMAEAFNSAVQKSAQLLLDAASKKEPLKRAEQMRLEFTAERKRKRKCLADELRDGRRRLRELQARVTTAEYTVARAQALVRHDGQPYPAVPPASLTPHKEGAGLPAEPGVYFLWRGDIIEYVGKSRRLCGRVKIPGHHVLQTYHRISYVLLEERELTWAECYYIGTLRPAVNFGRMASHNKGA